MPQRQSPIAACAALAAAAAAALALAGQRPAAAQQHSSVAVELASAKQAASAGVSSAVWKHLERAMQRLRKAKKPSTPAIDAAVRKLLRSQAHLFDPTRAVRAESVRAGSVPTGSEARDENPLDPETHVQVVLQHARAGLPISKQACLVQILADMPATARDALRTHARTNTSSMRRLVALLALLSGEQAADPSDAADTRDLALMALLFDRSTQLQRQLLAKLRPDADSRDVAYVSRYLRHRQPRARIRAAETLAQLGHDAAIEPLLAAAAHAASGLAPRAGGGGGQSRGHVAFMRQTSYVQDFDAEIASSAFIADPKVSAIQDGAVLDATLINVSTVRTIRRSYRRALRRLVGKDPGRDIAQWRAKVRAAQKQRAQSQASRTGPRASMR
ncbi:MAG: hypothetical protein AB8H80_02620 [Planctomycetota bacterium]